MSVIDEQQLKPVAPWVLNSLSNQAKGLVAWWPMAHPGGNTLFDLSGAAYHGTLTNGPAWSADFFGNSALSFDGTNDYVTFPTFTGTPSAGYTVSAWICRQGGTGNRTILSWKYSDSWSMIFRLEGDQLALYHRFGAGSFTSTSAGTVADRVWYHVAAVWDTTTIRLYINGSQASSAAQTVVFAWDSGTNIGRQVNDLGEFFQGQIGDTRVYRRGLSAGDIWELYDPQTRYELYYPLGRRLWFIPAAGGTQYNITPSGAITPTSALIKQDQKLLSGAVTPAGALAKQDQKALAGSITPDGTALKDTQKALGGTVASSGSIVKSLARALSGALTPAGALIKSIQKAFGGSITPTSTLSTLKTILVSLAGAITPSGALVKQTQKALSGAITPVSTLVKSIARALAGSITPAATLNNLKIILLSFVGSIAPSGSLTRRAEKVLGGTVAPTGAIGRAITKAFAGVLAFAGALANIVSGVGVATKVRVTLSDTEDIAVTLSDENGG